MLIRLRTLVLTVACTMLTVAAHTQDNVTLMEKASSGDANAQYELGKMYVTGEGEPQDFAQGAMWYRRAADQGYADAQLSLGAMYARGHGVPQDNVQAAFWMRKSADQGGAFAQYSLGFLYGIGAVVPQDYAQSILWFRKAADQGFAAAQFSLGVDYEKGLGVPKDDAQAAVWYRKAADQGNAGAQSELGGLYAAGEGVPLDSAKAIFWLRKASDQGNAEAQCGLGLIYYKGLGVTQDDTQAAAWFRKAADQGNTDGQNLLGILYAVGEGVPLDHAEAYFWLELGSAGKPIYTAQGDLSTVRDGVASHLSRTVLRQTQERVRKWAEAHPLQQSAMEDIPPDMQPTPVAPSPVAPDAEAHASQPANESNFTTPGSAQDAIQQAIQNAARHPGGVEASNATSRPLNTGNVDILSDTQGVNFQPYIARIMSEIYQQWLPLIPDEARPPQLKQGYTLIRLKIFPDGTIGAMHIDDSAHDNALNLAAWDSIEGQQFPPLPKQFTGPDLELRIHFLVNKGKE